MPVRRVTALLAVAAALLCPSVASAVDFTVTTATDAELDNDCPPGSCSLHQAITEANQTEGADTIRFSIGAEGAQATITDAGSVPIAQITDAVTIDGWTQGAAGYSGPPLVELAGPGPMSSPGLRTNGAGSDVTIRGLAINGFQQSAIQVNAGHTTIVGNYLGTSLDGMAGAGNGGWGVDVSLSGDDATIGGDTAAEGNLIAGNTLGGVRVDSAKRPTIQGNRIGLNAAGTNAISNGGPGVSLNGDVRGAIVGGPTTTKGAAPGNVIVAAGSGGGIFANNSFTAEPPVIRGNTIGTTPGGATGMGNTGPGVDANNRTIVGSGGTSGGNVIAANSGPGVLVSTNAEIAYNIVGLAPDGITGLGNDGAGVQLDAPANVSFNTIAANGGWGVTASSLAPNTVVAANIVGTDNGGTVDRANTAGGVNIDGVDDGVVRDNLISGHMGAAPTTAGLRLDETERVAVHGNRIGLNGAGNAAIPNTRGILFSGMSADTVIGPTAAGQQPNTISGNGVGIRSEIFGAQPNTITRNRIGTDADGDPLPNTGDGIAVAGGTDDLSIVRNAIAHNGDLAIDLGDDGVSANDPGDADGGPNGMQNRPSVSDAAAGGGRTVVRGSLDSLPSRAYRIDVYRSASCDPSGSGEGATWIGSTETSTGDAGPATWKLDLTGTATKPGEVITATATARASSAGQLQDTSELSPCATAAQLPSQPPPDDGNPPPPPPPDKGPTPEPERSVGAAPVDGRVTVTLPDGRVIRLTGNEEIPMGSTVDTTAGRVRLTAAGPAGSRYVAEFAEGAFRITQDESSLVDLALQGEVGPCPKASAGSKPRAGAAARRKKRRLWGRGKGRFRTSGRHSASVVKGTTWLVEDGCDGTRTRVTEGVVKVADYATGEVSDVAAGQSKLVKPRPLPKLGRTMNVVRVGKSGRTLSGKRLKGFQQVKGTPRLDAERGAVRIVTASGDAPVANKELGRLPTYWSTFSQGRFSAKQAGSGLTNVKLLGELRCASAARAKPAAVAEAAKRKKRRKRKRLFGDGSGRFRVSGKHSAAVVRGTRWLVEDTCAGTLTRVVSGVVAVEDFVRDRTVVLEAGDRYLAKPRRRR